MLTRSDYLFLWTFERFILFSLFVAGLDRMTGFGQWPVIEITRDISMQKHLSAGVGPSSSLARLLAMLKEESLCLAEPQDGSSLDHTVTLWTLPC